MLIFPLFVTSEPVLAIIPAVFLSVKFISLSLTVFTVAVIALIPAELSFFTLTVPLLLTTNSFLAPTILSALIPTDPVLSTSIVPLFDSVTLGVPTALFPNIAAEPVEVLPRVIVPSFLAVFSPLATATLGVTVLSSVVSIAIPADSPFFTFIAELTLLVAFESLAKIPPDSLSSRFIVPSLIRVELSSPNIAADFSLFIVIVEVVEVVELFSAVAFFEYKPTPLIILDIKLPWFIAFAPSVEIKPTLVVVLTVFPESIWAVESFPVANNKDVPTADIVPNLVLSVVSKFLSILAVALFLIYPRVEPLAISNFNFLSTKIAPIPVEVTSLKKEKVAPSSKVTLAALVAVGLLVKLKSKTSLNLLVLVEYSPTEFFPTFKLNPSLKWILSLSFALDKNPIVVPVVELLFPISTGTDISIFETTVPPVGLSAKFST